MTYHKRKLINKTLQYLNIQILHFKYRILIKINKYMYFFY